MKNALYLVLFMLFFSCGGKRVSTANKPLSAEEKVHQNTYYLQHRLIPGWTFESNGTFYYALTTGNFTKMKEVATELISAEYASAITVEHRPEDKGVLITFPKPTEPPLCYYTFLLNEKNKYYCYTYEKTVDLFGDGKGPFAVLASWTQSGHQNYGGRDFSTADEFVAAVKKLHYGE